MATKETANESLLPNDGRMKPILILPKGKMSAEDRQRLNDNGICTVECDDPAAVKFLDPIPSAASRTAVEDAAIRLSRKVLATDFWGSGETRQLLAAAYVDILVRGTKLDPRKEKEQEIFDATKMEEVRKIAREEARAERAAKKVGNKKQPATG